MHASPQILPTAATIAPERDSRDVSAPQTHPGANGSGLAKGVKTVTIKLPWPPTVNHYWKSRIAGTRAKPFVQVYIASAGKVFRAKVNNAIIARFGQQLRGTTARLAVSILAVMPDRRTRDLSNLLKATEDALTHARVWGDDSQIDDIRVIRGPVKAPGWIEVTITRAANQGEHQATIPGMER